MLGTYVGIAQNAFQELGMEGFLRVKRNCNSSPIRVLVDHMASTLTREGKSSDKLWSAKSKAS
jgi:hypothetical protein